MKASLSRDIATGALQMALTRRTLNGSGSPLCHSDQGSQYASGDYQALLDQAGITCSMSRRGDCYSRCRDREFLLYALETELTGHPWLPEPPERENRRLPEYIEAFYNLGAPPLGAWLPRARPNTRLACAPTITDDPRAHCPSNWGKVISQLHATQ